MATANEILNLDFAQMPLLQAAKSSFSAQLVRTLAGRINKLKSITEEVGESDRILPPNIDIETVFKKFKNHIKSNSLFSPEFDRKELRTLTNTFRYSNRVDGEILNSPGELKQALAMLNDNWRELFLKQLIDVYLSNWSYSQRESIKILEDFIFDKLSKYDGSRLPAFFFKTNERFLHLNNGDNILGYELFLKGVEISKAAKYINVPQSWFTYPYFSKVILAFYEKGKKDIHQHFEDLNKALNEHNNATTNKRVVSKLIIQANEPTFANLQDKVKTIAFNLVGDPGNASNWSAFEIATDSEKEDLKKARGIFNEWITREFINVFFEKCINDSRRKKFWLKYAKQINQFRVVGSSNIKRILSSDNRISKFVGDRFSNTNSARDSNAALMFKIKNHLFIEFSDEGAFYAYKLPNSKAPSIDATFFDSTSDLKDTSFDWLAYRTGRTIYRMSEQGRLGHNDGDLNWEEVASYWLKNKADINV